MKFLKVLANGAELLPKWSSHSVASSGMEAAIEKVQH
jgi:hypothetical protein